MYRLLFRHKLDSLRYCRRCRKSEMPYWQYRKCLFALSLFKILSLYRDVDVIPGRTKQFCRPRKDIG